MNTILEMSIDEISSHLEDTDLFITTDDGRKHRLYLGDDGKYYYWVHNPKDGLDIRPLDEILSLKIE